MRRLVSRSINIRRVIFGVAVVCSFSLAANGAPWDGSGTAEDPYKIWDACDMQAIGADANYWDACFKLVNDINLAEYTGMSFHRIGEDWDKPFTGVFDGNCHTVKNFNWSSNTEMYIGIFGYTGEGSRVANLFLKDFNIVAQNGDGGLLPGPNKYIGALAGGNSGTIMNCQASGSLWAGVLSEKVGALVGFNGGTISNCSTSGNVTIAGFDNYIGGFVGRNYGIISNCYATTTVSGSICVGGLIGENGGEAIESYASGNVSGSNRVGGLAGYSENVKSCYATGNVSGGSDAGGLVGENDGAIANSYATGDVSGSSEVGGLVGSNFLSSQIQNSYAIGLVGPYTYHGGGLLGYNESGFVENSFWDVNSSGQESSAGGTGKTTAEMQTMSTFTDAGWDFVGEVINGPNDIWDICDGTNYPKLAWQKPLAGDFVCPDGVNFADYAFFAEYWLQTIYGDCSGVELTGDGKVNLLDFAVFAKYWMLTNCGDCGGADLTGDENVDMADLYVFAIHWLETEYAEVDLTNDGQVGLDDLQEFTENWLAGQ